MLRHHSETLPVASVPRAADAK